jgi:cell division protein FtsQ
MATLRRSPKPATRPPAVVPVDVRVMNAATVAVAGAVLVGLLVGAFLWLVRSPLFPIRAVQLEGELARNSVPTIRANIATRLAGNFFSVDLQAGRATFEAVPWVRRAVVRRVWPDRLAVRLEEHQAAALWQGDDGEDRLVNSHGEVFDANVGDVEDDSLPVLSGPEGSAATMLALVQRLQPALQQLELGVTKLHLSGRGSWRAELDSGASIELGRGSVDEVVARTERFVRTLPTATQRWRAPLEYADLRHTDGYAVRLRGVSTTTTAAPGGAAKSN